MLVVNNIRSARLNQEDHTYIDSDGVVAKFSISAIAQKGAVLPGMTHIKAAADVGSHVHAVMHHVIGKNTSNGVVCFASCLEMMKSSVFSEADKEMCSRYFELLLSMNLKNPAVSSEHSLIADFNGVPVGGTADLILNDGNHLYIVDFKTAKMAGFKKEHHLQLYGYSLFQPENSNVKCFVFHLEDKKHLFDSPVPNWVVEEFEDNFNYLLTKDQEKPVKPLAPTQSEHLENLCDALNEVQAAKSELAKALKEAEAKEKELLKNVLACIDDVGLGMDEVVAQGHLTIQKNKTRRHALTYRPELEQYYDCTVTEEYLMTYRDKKFKIKIKGDNNE